MRELPADDDGFEWSLRLARRACLALFGLLVFFWAATVALQLVPGVPQEQPLIVGVFVALAVSIVTAAPFLRERIAQIGIGEHLARDREFRRPKVLYATFATATAIGVLVAQAPALFGFIATALTRSLIPVAIGTVVTGAVWAALWPRRRLWERWTWQARLRRDDPEAAPAAAPGTDNTPT